jgi:hypothetical protein
MQIKREMDIGFIGCEGGRNPDTSASAMESGYPDCRVLADFPGNRIKNSCKAPASRDIINKQSAKRLTTAPT